MAEWITSAPEDREFAAQIEHALHRRGSRVDNVLLFVLSPESVASAACRAQLTEASAKNAMLVPLLRRELGTAEVPAELAPLAQIPFRERDPFPTGIEALIARLGADLQFDVFISYSRKDTAEADRLVESLWRAGKTTWVDRTKLLASEEWQRAIYRGIEAADHFLVLLSPDSITSAFCELEVKHALAQNKRILPVRLREVDPTKVPAALAERQWINLDVAEIVRAIEIDPAWTRMHTELLRRANAWEHKGRDGASLLRGSELEAAERWLTDAGENLRRNPTPLQTDFILASRTGATRRLRRTIVAVAAALIVSLGLGTAALIFRRGQKLEETHARQNAAEANIEDALRRGAANEALAWAAHVPASLANADRLSRALHIGPSHTLIPATDDRHEGALAWSSDQSKFAYGPGDGTVTVWNLCDGSKRSFGTPKEPQEAFQMVDLAFSPSGHAFAGLDRAGQLWWWNLDSGEGRTIEESRSFESCFNEDDHLTWSSNRLVSTSCATACVFRAEQTAPVLIECRKHSSGTRLHWTHDGSRLLSIAPSGQSAIWEVESGAQTTIAELRGDNGAWSASQLVVGGHDRRLHLFDVSSGAVRKVRTSDPAPFRLGPGQIGPSADHQPISDDGRAQSHHRFRRLEWGADETKIAYLYGGTAGLWDSVSPTVVTLESDDMHTIAWSGKKIARAAAREVRVYESDKPGWSDRRVRPLEGADPTIAWSPNGRFLALITERGVLDLWDTEAGLYRIVETSTAYTRAITHDRSTWTFEEILLGKEGDAAAVGWLDEGKLLAYAGAQGGLHIRELATGNERVFEVSGGGELRRFSIAPDRRSIAFGSETAIALWSVAIETPVWITGLADIGSLAWSPDNSRLALATYDGLIEIRDRAGNKLDSFGEKAPNKTRVDLRWPLADVLSLTFHENDLHLFDLKTKASRKLPVLASSHAWSKSGELAVGGWHEVSFFTRDGGEARATLKVALGYNERVQAVAWSRDGKLIAFAGGEGRIEIVDVATRVRATFFGHSGPVVALAWAANDDGLVSSSGDGTVRVWPALWREEHFRAALEGRTNWVVGDDLVARPGAFRGLPMR